jgi:hypothetical protein
VSNTYCVMCLFCFSSSCIPYVASFSGMSISDCSFGFLERLFTHTKMCLFTWTKQIPVCGTVVLMVLCSWIYNYLCNQCLSPLKLDSRSYCSFGFLERLFTHTKMCLFTWSTKVCIFFGPYNKCHFSHTNMSGNRALVAIGTDCIGSCKSNGHNFTEIKHK